MVFFTHHVKNMGFSSIGEHFYEAIDYVVLCPAMVFGESNHILVPCNDFHLPLSKAQFVFLESPKAMTGIKEFPNLHDFRIMGGM